MIEDQNPVNRYGSTMAVNDLSFSIRPGMVTGFLGPNGAGKTTTMRMILGPYGPTQGSVAVGGRSYRDLPAPMHEVLALLEAKGLHGGRRAYAHLLCLAQSNGIPRSRVDEELGIVGLEDVAKRRAKGLSLGMGQRLGIAWALLGDQHDVRLTDLGSRITYLASESAQETYSDLAVPFIGQARG
jgi:ABC-2 type transport system ATP-binding protein